MKLTLSIAMMLTAFATQAQTVIQMIDYYDVKVIDVRNVNMDGSGMNYQLVLDGAWRGIRGASIRSVDACTHPWAEAVDSGEAAFRMMRAFKYRTENRDAPTPGSTRDGYPPGVIPHVGVSVYSDGSCRFHALGAL